jgi:hypothetical protein
MIRIARRIGKSEHFEVTERLNNAVFRLVVYTVVLPPGLADFPSTRTGSWALSLYDAQGNAIVRGIAVVAGIDLLYPYRHLSVPSGSIVCDTLDGLDPDLTAFADGRARLLYKPS